jgi:uncharacterized protein YegL
MRQINIESGNRLKVVVNLLLDESTSMISRKTSVISGVNEYVNELKSKSDDVDYFINIIKFNTESSFSVKDLPISKFKEFTDYNPNGGTALLDAVGDAISGVDKNADNAIFIIMTDGDRRQAR